MAAYDALPRSCRDALKYTVSRVKSNDVAAAVATGCPPALIASEIVRQDAERSKRENPYGIA